MRSDVQTENSRWLFTSPLAGGGGIFVAAALQAAQLVVYEYWEAVR